MPKPDPDVLERMEGLLSTLPAETVSDDAQLQSWVERALAFAEDLPEKRR